jgi:4-amino-4-deoxy-L-arabinose transferase-like glycosyltransferase
MNYLLKYYSSRAIILYLLLILAPIMLFKGNVLPYISIIFGFIQVIGFFYFTQYFSARWMNLPEKILKKRIFRISLLVRIIYAIASYYFYLHMTGQPFEYETADSSAYHEEGIWYAEMFSKGMLFNYLSNVGNYSDQGYPFYLSIIYVITGNNILMARIVTAVFGAFTAVLIYKLGKRSFGEDAGRMAGIMAMLLPNFIYYNGLHLKEVIMVFLLVAFAERSDYAFRMPKMKIKAVLIALLFGLSLFFFRTVLGAAAIFAFLLSIILMKGRYQTIQKRIGTIFIFALFAVIMTSNTLVTEISNYWSERGENLSTGIESRYSSNKFVQYAKSSVFAPFMLVLPFPVIVNVPTQQNAMLISGATFTRNVYAFFILIALIYLIPKQRYRQHLFILSLLASYLAILASSTFAFSERFHVPALPFLIILAAFGITKLNRKNSKYFIPYLVLVFVMVIAWNYVKLYGRGGS